MDKQLSNIDMAFQFLDLHAPDVSESDVRWHLDHIFRVVIGISTVLKESNPQDYRININPSRSYVFINGKIQRGKAQAPKSVSPTQSLSNEELMNEYILAKKLYVDTRTLLPKCNFNHHSLGQMNLRQARKFMRIHTQHHLDIINEIIIAKT